MAWNAEVGFPNNAHQAHSLPAHMDKSRVEEGLTEDQKGYYAHYDQIMLLEDPGSSSPLLDSKLSRVAFLATCTFFSMFGGFAVSLAVSGKRFRAKVKSKADPKKVSKESVTKEVELEDPVLLATRALGWGTLYSVMGTGAIGMAVYSLIRIFSKHDRFHPVPSEVVSVPSGAYAYMYGSPEGTTDELRIALSGRLNSNSIHLDSHSNSSFTIK